MTDQQPEHDRLSPSAAHRWLHCTASVALIEAAGVPGESSTYADEGTAAHDLAARYAAKQLRGDRMSKVAWRKAFPDYADDAEMDKHAKAYAKELQRLADDHEGPVVPWLERRVDTGVPGCTGTADALLYSAADGLLDVVDLKYGAGVVVSAEDNPQMLCYAVGAIRAVEMLGEVKRVRLTVVQPRAGGTSTWETTWNHLVEFAARLEKVERQIASDEVEYMPGPACRWCPVKGECRPRAEHEAALDFKGGSWTSHPDLLTPAEVAEIINHADQTRDWLKAVEAHGLTLAYEGEGLPGYKAVMAGGKRVLSDPEGLRERLLMENGAVPMKDLWTLQPPGIGKLESALGDRMTELAGPYITRTTGKPALVRDTDSREAVTAQGTAAADFADPVTPDATSGAGLL